MIKMNDEQLSRLQRRARQDIPSLLGAWLGDARAELEQLTKAAADESVSGEGFARMLRDFAGDPVRLARLMRPEVLAAALEQSMGTAMAVGRAEVRQRVKDQG